MTNPSLPLIQNFTLPAGDTATIPVTIDPATLGNFDWDDETMQAWWEVYDQAYGVPAPGVNPIIVKTNLSGSSLIIPDSPSYTFLIEMVTADTIGLLRNYYHEATIIDVNGVRITPFSGIMTITPTENRPL